MNAPAKAKSNGKLEPVYTIEELIASDQPTVQPLIEKLLYPGVTLFVGRPKGGKTYLILNLLLNYVNGLSFAGHFRTVKPGRVLFLSLEDGASRTSDRVKASGLAYTDGARDLRVMFECNLQHLDQHLTEHPCEVLVVDTLTKAAQTINVNGKTSGGDVFREQYARIDFFRGLVNKHGVAVIILHHTKQHLPAQVTPIEAISGSFGYAANPDAAWLLRKGKEAHSLILSTEGKEIPHQDYELSFNPSSGGGYKFVGEGDEVNRSAQQREILELVGEEGYLSIRDASRILGKNYETTRGLFNRLMRDGLLSRDSKRKFFLSENIAKSYVDRD